MADEKKDIYAELPLSDPCDIRLLVLQPAASTSEPLECSMDVVCLYLYSRSLLDSYTALSYVWGDASSRRPILLNKEHYDITVNLDSALRHVRDKERVVILWVDALCINQSDNHEKAEQVKMMGAIYSVAAHTVIYLGDSTEASQNILQRCADTYPQFGRLLAYPYIKITDEDIRLRELAEKEIGARIWFSRVWILQELLLSRDPWIQIGEQRVTWDVLCAALISPKKPRPGSALSVLSSMNELRARCFSNLGDAKRLPKLWDTMVARRGCGATDPRDRLFSILGITKEGALFDHELLRVTYDLPYAYVYNHASQFFLNPPEGSGIYLDLLLQHAERVDPFHSVPGLASWAVDWSTPRANVEQIESTGLFSTLLSATILLPDVIAVRGVQGSKIKHFGPAISEQFVARVSAKLNEHSKSQGFRGSIWSTKAIRRLKPYAAKRKDILKLEARVQAYSMISNLFYAEYGEKLLPDDIFAAEEPHLLTKLDIQVLNKLEEAERDKGWPVTGSQHSSAGKGPDDLEAYFPKTDGDLNDGEYNPYDPLSIEPPDSDEGDGPLDGFDLTLKETASPENIFIIDIDTTHQYHTGLTSSTTNSEDAKPEAIPKLRRRNYEPALRTYQGIGWDLHRFFEDSLFMKLFPVILFPDKKTILQRRRIAKLENGKTALISPIAMPGDIIFLDSESGTMGYIIRPKNDVDAKLDKLVREKFQEHLERERAKRVVVDDDWGRFAVEENSVFDGHFTFVGMAVLPEIEKKSTEDVIKELEEPITFDDMDQDALDAEPDDALSDPSDGYKHPGYITGELPEADFDTHYIALH